MRFFPFGIIVRTLAVQVSSLNDVTALPQHRN
jgi:hypothetical protein